MRGGAAEPAHRLCLVLQPQASSRGQQKAARAKCAPKMGGSGTRPMQGSEASSPGHQREAGNSELDLELRLSLFQLPPHGTLLFPGLSAVHD